MVSVSVAVWLALMRCIRYVRLLQLGKGGHGTAIVDALCMQQVPRDAIVGGDVGAVVPEGESVGSVPCRILPHHLTRDKPVAVVILCFVYLALIVGW